MKTIAERLKKAMLLSAGATSQYALAAKSGVPQPTIMRILDGTSNDPRKKTVLPLAEALEVRYEWLKEGSGISGNKLLDAANALDEPYDDTNVVSATGPSRTYAYPEISEVQAGNAAEAIDLLQPGEGERHQSDAWAGENGFWLRVRGDSMTRSGGISFPEGMIVLVAPGIDPRSGQFIVAKVGNDVTFKQYVVDAGVRYLKPLNAAFQQQVMDDRWQLVGTVIDAKWPKSAF